MPPVESVLQLLAYFAYTAQAMTAALAAGRRRMDWFGVAVLGSITALGGGSVRDVLLGHYPLVWVANPGVLAVTALAALAVIPLVRIVHHLKMTFLVLDAIGLVVFTVAGCEVALRMEQPLAIVIVAGMITGCVGGVLRDVLCNDVPLLFRSELYASVSVVTGVVYVGGLRLGVAVGIATLAACMVGFTLRMLAIRYKWGMPTFIYDRDLD